ncbi:MAG: hypothetical protein JNJ99_02035 [Crocinitomicaceae bacterium]|nr:hypothetical protein [Crocinitomicaceae bacterium]
MEKDVEVSGGGNALTTEFRQYDSRVGRWLSIDPKTNSLPYRSPYESMFNNPNFFNDPKGDFPPILVPILAGVFGYFYGESTHATDKAMECYEKGDMIGYQEWMAYSGQMAIGAVSSIFAGGLLINLGIKGTAIYIAEEVTVECVEQITGVPLIINPTDIIKYGYKEAFQRQLLSIIEGVRAFRTGLINAAQNIKAEKWNHIINGSKSSGGHNWDKLVHDPINNKEGVQSIITSVVEDGKVIVSSTPGVGEIVNKVEGQWVVVKYGTDPISGNQVINDSWVESRPEMINKYEQMSNTTP